MTTGGLYQDQGVPANNHDAQDQQKRDDFHALPHGRTSLLNAVGAVSDR
jgi:hypothetical protein